MIVQRLVEQVQICRDTVLKDLTRFYRGEGRNPVKLNWLQPIINDFTAGYLSSGEWKIVKRSIKNFTHGEGIVARLNERYFARGSVQEGVSEQI